MNLSDRINAVYRTHTGAVRDRGARTWFAKTLRVDVRSVTRWCDGSQTFDGPAAACLTLLECVARVIDGYLWAAARCDTSTVGGRWQHDAYLANAQALQAFGTRPE